MVLQQEAVKKGVGLVVLFEGWNGAGKGSRISDLMYNPVSYTHLQERTFEEVRRLLGERGVRHLRPNELDDEQRAWLAAYVHDNVMPFLSPQIINARHPFPRLENGALYVVAVS